MRRHRTRLNWINNRCASHMMIAITEYDMMGMHMVKVVNWVMIAKWNIVCG